MPFNLVYYSQQDPKWKEDKLGFGKADNETIGWIGCALTSVAMMLSGHGCTETPKTLNKKLQNVGGFWGSAIVWYKINELYPQVRLSSIIKCNDTPAPLAQIDAALTKGQPAIVCVDSLASPEFRSHYVVLIGRKGNDYLMLDPWPYQTDINKETYLMPRYSQGNPLQRSIMQVLLYENIAADGLIQLPGAASPTTGTSSGTSQPSSPPADVSTSGSPKARVRESVTFGLNVRTSEDTSSKDNILEVVPAGTVLTITEPGGWTQIGAINQWVRVCTPSGKEGLVAAWYLEQIPGAVYPTAEESPAPSTETPTPTPAPRTSKLVVKVKKSGLPVYESASGKSRVLATEKTGTRLVVVEDAAKATDKIGTAGKWLNVKASNGKRGFLDAGFVRVV